MRILFLTQIVPYPLDSGPKIKTYSVLRYLSQEHEVHLVSFVRSLAEAQAAHQLGSMCQTVTCVRLTRSRPRDLLHLTRGLLRGRSFLIERDRSLAMREAIAELLEQHKFDAVHADQISMAQFAIDLPIALRVLDEHNAVWTIVKRAANQETFLPRRLAADIEWRRLKAYEGEVCRRFDRTTIVSREDYDALADAAGGNFAAIEIPIAVDTDRLVFRPRTEESKHVLSVATMFYPPNVEAVWWFARSILPIIHRALPTTKLYVVGSRPPDKIRKLSQSEARVVVTGYVENLDPILDDSGVLIVPLSSGSGMRVKILEAFARGIPVVSTTIGVEGIEAEPDKHLLVADDPTSFAGAVQKLLTDPLRAREIAMAARALVVDRYDWRTALKDLDFLYPSGQSDGGEGFARVATATSSAQRLGQAAGG